MSEGQTNNRRPIAVLISDIHFTPNTLTEATAAFIQAQQKAYQLRVPLVVCGDTLDSKAVMRAECVNRLIDLLSPKDRPATVFLVGNHDLCNEKAEEHALHFLKQYAVVVDQAQDGMLSQVPVRMLPYQNSAEAFLQKIAQPPGIILCHQGIKAGNSGHYMHDQTAVSLNELSGYRIISGHYHARQTIELNGGGEWSFVGNPYTLTFGEANDPDKGFQILDEHGTLTFVPTGLRRHRIIDVRPTNAYVPIHSEQDILWVRFYGPSDYLATFDKLKIANTLSITQDFSLDKIPVDRVFTTEHVHAQAQDVLDSVIDAAESTPERKLRLKQLWRRL